jgi:hypothetical protein
VKELKKGSMLETQMADGKVYSNIEKTDLLSGNKK